MDNKGSGFKKFKHDSELMICLERLSGEVVFVAVELELRLDLDVGITESYTMQVNR